MADKYAVIRTDLMSGTKQPADLVSLRFYDSSEPAAVENGVIVKLEGYEDGEREVMKAVAAQKNDDLNDCAIVAGVEVMYDERKRTWMSLSMRLVRRLVVTFPGAVTSSL